MKTVLITGIDGFIGRNLKSRLALREDIRVIGFGRSDSDKSLASMIKKADFIYHIAGANRPQNENEFLSDNRDLTERIVSTLNILGKKTPLLITSSIQAELDTPYGRSKKAAEDAIFAWNQTSGAPVYVYRLPGVFGKWSRPNYNSVVATFCYNISRGLPIIISDRDHVITLAYIDDVIDDFIMRLDNSYDNTCSSILSIPRTFQLSLGDLSRRLQSLHEMRSNLIVPDLNDLLNKFLYATYTSYLPSENFSYSLPKKSDDRGWLAEFIKSKHFGQVFISTTKPGITRGEHWHNTKVEKFLIVSGRAEVLFRNKQLDRIGAIRYEVSGEDAKVIDIPVGFVHSIKNIGDTDLVTIFWANEIFNNEIPDTYYEKVIL